MIDISLEPVFGWAALIPLAIILVASLWLTITSEGVSARQRTLLVLLRLAAMLVLLLGWLRPGIVTEVSRESAGAIAVLMDISESMTLPSGIREDSRWEVQRDTWQRLAELTNLSIGESKIVPYFYSDKASPASMEGDPKLGAAFDQEPTGRSTDLGSSLSELTRQQLDPPLRAVIMMGDAAQTVLPANVDPGIVARQMGQLDQPLYMVAIGPRGEKSQLRDVGIEGLAEHFSAFAKKELGVRFLVSAQGVQNQPINLQLKLKSSGKPDLILNEQTISATQGSEKIPMEFLIVVPEVGEYLLEASVQVDGQDQIATNNLAVSFLTVREGGARILYLEGEPRREQLFLKRSLNESLDFDVDYEWFPEKFRLQWSRNEMAERINFDSYDVIMIGDLDSSAFSPRTQRALVNRIRAGAGLLLLGGYHSFDAGGYGREQTLRQLFPVEMRRGRQAFDAPIDTSFHITRDVKVRPTRPHPITDLEPEPDNTRVWQSLKPLQGMNKFEKLVAEGGVQVLLESENQEPVLVTGQIGKGLVLAFAGDSTWRWWTAGQSKRHKQFWRQAILWLIRRDSLNQGFRLDLESRRMLIDETPELRIEWFGGSENTEMPQDVKVELLREETFVQRLVVAPDNQNTQIAKIKGLTQPGLYQAILSAEDATGKKHQANIAFIVKDESRELSRPDADFQMMTNIVSANQAAGGRRVYPDEIDEVVKLLKQKQDATKVTNLEKRRLGDAAWDSWIYLVLFCALMTFEWVLRKTWQLP